MPLSISFISCSCLSRPFLRQQYIFSVRSTFDVYCINIKTDMLNLSLKKKKMYISSYIYLIIQLLFLIVNIARNAMVTLSNVIFLLYIFAIC